MICTQCNKDNGTLHKHHIDGNHKNDVPENVVYICRHCHARAHTGPNIGEHWVRRLPYGWSPPGILWEEVKRQYDECFPRAKM